MCFEIFLHRFCERLKIENDRVPGDLKIDLKIVVDSAIAESSNFFPGNVN